ncbi:MAG: twitching motility protein PilT [Planctomycetota bacterium]|jgi:twitching motility protein PilT
MAISRILEKLLNHISQEGASDLHLVAGRVPVMRVNRELVPLTKEAVLSSDDMHAILLSVVSEDKVARVYAGHEIDFSFQFHDTLRLRGGAYRTSNGAGLAFRVVAEIKTLQELRLPESLAHFTRQKQGFFLIVGPTGQGKTTTMAALIDLINRERREHIVTIENPIEYLIRDKMSVVDQREIGIDTGTFHEALRASFRQDVDVIMVGEMRDPETISTAVTAAETGHLVFSTLHTNDAAQTIDRIIDSFGADQQRQVRNQLAASLLGIFSIRLIPSIKGGLVPAYELLINNNATQNLIREGRTHEIYSVIETSRSEGMIDMNHSLLDLVRQNEITIEDALRFSGDPEVLQSLI